MNGNYPIRINQNEQMKKNIDSNEWQTEVKRKSESETHHIRVEHIVRVLAVRVARSNVGRHVGRVAVHLLEHLAHQRRPVEEAAADQVEAALHLRVSIQSNPIRSDPRVRKRMWCDK